MPKHETWVDPDLVITPNPAGTPIAAPAALLPDWNDELLRQRDAWRAEALANREAISRVRNLAANINAGWRDDETWPRNVAQHIYKAIDGEAE